MKKEYSYPYYLSIWFWFLVLTITYLSLLVYIGLPLTGERFTITSIVGMFVPFGFTNAFFLNVRLRAILPSLLILFFGDRLAKMFKIEKIYMKIIFNLIALLLVTMATDLLFGGHWDSLNLLLGKSPQNFDF